MSKPTSSHAYGIGVIAIIIALSASVVFYTSFYLPESLAKPSVPEEILEAEVFDIKIVVGAVVEGNENYVPNKSEVILGFDNHAVWTNTDDTAHTVTPDVPYTDSYSGEFGSPGVIKPGDTYEFLFTQPGEILYHCQPHPWMTGKISILAPKF